MTATLAASLQRAWGRTLPASPEIGADLLRRWQEPHRHYHDLRHLAESLAALAAFGCDDLAARLAIWFHDAVLELRGDDEQRSAALAATALAAAGYPSSLVTDVERLVLVTASHRPTGSDPRACAVSDADLWILGAPPRRYSASVADLRLEYAEISDPDWILQRRLRLAARLATPIYHSRAAKTELTHRARQNLQRELRALALDAAEPPSCPPGG